MIRQIVGRLHVSASPRDVIRAVRKALLKSARQDPKHREARKGMYREALSVHGENRDLYHAVMTGRF